MPDYDLIAILGPTASGKTPFAAALAAELNTEIISADSRQIYRSMDIGTGKDLADYIVNGKQVPYHLIDIADPGYKYNVFEYQRDFLNAYESIKQKGSLPVDRVVQCAVTAYHDNGAVTVVGKYARQALYRTEPFGLYVVIRHAFAIHIRLNLFPPFLHFARSGFGVIDYAPFIGFYTHISVPFNQSNIFIIRRLIGAAVKDTKSL